MKPRASRLLPLSCLALLIVGFLPSSTSAAFNSFTRSDIPVGYQYGIAIADFNRDGNGDLAMVSNGSTVKLLLGKGNGNFDPEVLIPSGSTFSENVVTADVNGDSNPDLLVQGRLLDIGASRRRRRHVCRSGDLYDGGHREDAPHRGRQQ